MPADFLDTSALAKHYHAEAGSAEIDRLWNDPAHGLFVSRLSALEMVSVFAAKVRAGCSREAGCLRSGESLTDGSLSFDGSVDVTDTGDASWSFIRMPSSPASAIP